MTFNFQEYIEDQFDPKPQQINPDQVSINCINPDCDDNWRRRRKMTVNLADKKAFCFICGEKYNEIEFVATAEGISKFQAMKIVRTSAPKRTFGADRLETAIKTLFESPEDTESSIETESKPCLFPPWRRIEPGTPEWSYLEGRRISKDVIEHFGLVFCPSGPPTGTLCPECSIRKAGKRCCPYSGRIIIPIYRDGKAVAFQGRTIYDAIPKYLFPIDQPFESELYNWDHARFFGTLIITEGVTSAWRVWERNYHNVTATFGKSLKVNQEKMIKEESRINTVIMLWDGGTLPEAYAAGLRLKSHKKVLIAQLPGDLDPDECPDTPDYIEAAKSIESFDPLTVAMSKLA